MFGTEDVVPAGALLMAEMGLGETGFSKDCDVGRNKQRLRTYACRIGADAVKIVKEQYPDLISTCYRVRAKIYKLPVEQPPS